MAFTFTRKAVLASSAALALGVGVSALAMQVPGDRPPPPPPSDPAPPTPPPAEPRPMPGEREAQTHTGIVVDLFSYVEKTERPDEREPARPGAPGQRPGTPGAPGTPGGNGQDRDGVIDWADGDYADNIEAGVPIVLMVEEDRPWGRMEAQPHVITFDPDDSVSRQAHEELKNSAGEEVEVVGKVKGDRGPGGLRILVLEDIR